MSAPGPFVSQLTEWGIEHVPLRHATRSVSPGHDLAALPELTRQFRRLRPDIVHTHNPKPGLYGRLAARAAGVPGVVNTVHGFYAAPEDPWSRRTLVYALERAASWCSQVELFQNPEDLEVMRRLGAPPGKLELLGNGVDLGRFRPRRSHEDIRRARTALGVDTSALVVGTVGRLVREKGFSELFAAAGHMRSIRPEVMFVVIGPEDHSRDDALDAADMAAARSLGNVVFCGHRHDVRTSTPASTCTCFPPPRGVSARSAMEAAASGLPVIATDIRGCRQVVDHGENGLLVPLRDAGALTVAIAELVGNEARRSAMGLKGRRKAESISMTGLSSPRPWRPTPVSPCRHPRRWPVGRGEALPGPDRYDTAERAILFTSSCTRSAW